MLNPQAVAAKWARNMAASTESVKAGVQAVTESPMIKAAAQADRYLAGVQQNVEKWKQNLQAVSLESWKQSVMTKGINNMQAGVARATPKVQAFMSQFLPHVDAVAAQVRQMPKGGVEAGIARAAAMIRGIAAFKR